MSAAVLAVIPARGGSQGLPGKNIRPLGGMPLLGHVARTARAARVEMDVILSTDCENIAEVGRGLGIDVPFMRPPELATNVASSAAVALHALEMMERRSGRHYEVLVLLQPTCPFTRTATIESAVAAVRFGRHDFAGSVVEVVDEHPAYMLKRGEGDDFVPAFPDLYGCTRRQDLPRMFFRAGNVYATRRDVLVRTGSFMQPKATYVVVDRMEAININDSFDWGVAEAALKGAAGS